MPPLDTPASQAQEAHKRRRMRFSRSRFGCDSCRHHKKKVSLNPNPNTLLSQADDQCDETRPVCGRCDALRKVCAYSYPQGGRAASDVADDIDELDAPPAPYDPPTYDAPTSSYDAPSTSASTSAHPLSSPTMMPPMLSTVDPALSPVVPAVPVGTDAAAAALAEYVEYVSFSTSRHALSCCPSRVNAGYLHLCTQANASDSFLRAFSFSADVVVPPWTPPDAMGAVPPGSEFESFWNALVGSAGDDSEVSTDRTLIEYYRLVVSPTILGIEDGSSEFLRLLQTSCSTQLTSADRYTDCASLFYKGVASTATQEDQAAMMHAVLAVSAQHLSNFARAFNNLDKAISFNEQAAHHRSEALYLLRVSSKSASCEDVNEALLPSVTLLLTLSSLLKGDPDIIPSFLDQTQAYLDQIEHPSPAPHLPTINAIYSIYRCLQAIASSQPLDLNSVFQLHEPRDTWVRVADETVERLVGIVSISMGLKGNC